MTMAVLPDVAFLPVLGAIIWMSFKLDVKLRVECLAQQHTDTQLKTKIYAGDYLKKNKILRK